MHNLILEFPNHLSDSIDIANRQKIEFTERPKNIIICGLGGSGIGAEIIKEWLRMESSVPIDVCHNYHLPFYVDKTSLVIFCSYSGNTEETLHTLNQAINLGTMIIGITSGGQMSKILSKNKLPKIIIPHGLPPRSALAYPLVQLAAIFDELNISHKPLVPRIGESIGFIKEHQDFIVSKATHLSALIAKRQMIFYSEERLKPISLRTCQQINENGKDLAYYNVVPEMNHNEIVGWAQSPTNLFVVFLRSTHEFERNSQRLDFTEKLIRSKTSQVARVETVGENIVQETLYLIHLFDWLSLFVAENKKIDPVEVDVIDALKKELNK